jgi:LemA protein
MMKNWIPWVIAVVVVLYLTYLYNGLVTLRNRVRNAWSQIDVQLKRRHDLIPNIVASVKGYMAHERGLFETIVRAREKAVAAGSNVPARAAAEAVLDRSLHSIFALAESTPELKASANMLALQEELSSTENRIAFARQHYNDAVLAYNTALATVPSVFIARAFAFQPDSLYEVSDAAEREPVTVSF